MLNKDPKNRFALESLGYLYREDGDIKTAASYFSKLAQAYPDDYVAYLAMGDLFAGDQLARIEASLDAGLLTSRFGGPVAPAAERTEGSAANSMRQGASHE